MKKIQYYGSYTHILCYVSYKVITLKQYISAEVAVLNVCIKL